MVSFNRVKIVCNLFPGVLGRTQTQGHTHTHTYIYTDIAPMRAPCPPRPRVIPVSNRHLSYLHDYILYTLYMRRVLQTGWFLRPATTYLRPKTHPKTLLFSLSFRFTSAFGNLAKVLLFVCTAKWTAVQIRPPLAFAIFEIGNGRRFGDDWRVPGLLGCVLCTARQTISGPLAESGG